MKSKFGSEKVRERTDLANELVLCDECYRKAKRDEAIARFKAEVRNILCKKK